MSWIYSQALVAEYLEDTCSDGAPFAPSNGNPTPQAYLPPDKMTAFSRPSRFGMTFAPLTDDRGEELLTWFREDSRARTSAPPEKAQGSTASEATTAARPLDRNVMRLAALFVQPDGCYAGLPGVDAWPEQRDARRYSGPLPVVAHPPCQLWGAMANVNYARWGGEHNRPGNDGGCFASALDSVRRFGGVLEHPAKTKAWAAHGLAQPAAIGWQRTIDGGWVCEVWQSAYGHRANKATWLYYHGMNPPFALRWARPEGTHQIGFHAQRGKAANKPTLGKREANATPLEFRDELLRLAMKAHNA